MKDSTVEMTCSPADTAFVMADSTGMTPPADGLGRTDGRLPADSAFVSGSLVPDNAPAMHDATPDDSDSNTVSDTVIALTAIVSILYMRQILGILPMIAGCMLRWKENLNIEYNVKSKMVRDRLAIILIPAYAALVSGYGLWHLPFMDRYGDLPDFLFTTGAFLLFLSVRMLLCRIMRPSRMNHKVWKAGNDSFFSFFISAVLLSMATAAVMWVAGCGTDVRGMAVTWISGAVWLLFLFRKVQIFRNSCSLFSAILYLCSLEILPMAILVAPALIR